MRVNSINSQTQNKQSFGIVKYSSAASFLERNGCLASVIDKAVKYADRSDLDVVLSHMPYDGGDIFVAEIRSPIHGGDAKSELTLIGPKYKQLFDPRRVRQILAKIFNNYDAIPVSSERLSEKALLLRADNSLPQERHSVMWCDTPLIDCP